MKVSVVTAVFNRRGTVRSVIDSMRAQTYDGEAEHVIQDGGLHEGMLEIARAASSSSIAIASEKDYGIYGQ